MKPTAKQLTGLAGEEMAASLLLARGMRILNRNWRSRSLELDIVAEEGDTLVFVEVKARAAGGLQQPHEALGMAKRRALTRAATCYLAEYDLWHRSCRFDLVSIIMNGNNPVVEHIPHAFEFSPTFSGGNAAWQPW